MGAFHVRQMEVRDVEECVRIHQEAFPNFFLTFLGQDFLKEFYKSVTADPSGFGFVVEADTHLLGFVIGSCQPQGFYRRLLLRRWWRFAIASVGPLLSRPTIIGRLVRAFGKPSEELPASNCGTLMSIAVAPNCQSTGVGQVLLTRFLREAECIETLEYINLTTDCINNEKANRFYQKAGFELVRTFVTPEGRQMNEYMISLRTRRT